MLMFTKIITIYIFLIFLEKSYKTYKSTKINNQEKLLGTLRV